MPPTFALRFFAWTYTFESLCDWFYLDVKGYVTIGLGLLADPFALVARLDFVREDGSHATAGEVQAAWLVVHNAQHLKLGGGKAFRKLTKIRATQESLASLASSTLERFAAALRVTFPAWDTWPEAAHMGCLSMAWSMGSGFTAKYPAFVAACRALDWQGASNECHMSEVKQNDSFADRNVATKALFASLVPPSDAIAAVDVTDAGADRPLYRAPTA